MNKKDVFPLVSLEREGEINPYYVEKKNWNNVCEVLKRSGVDFRICEVGDTELTARRLKENDFIFFSLEKPFNVDRTVFNYRLRKAFVSLNNEGIKVKILRG